MLPIEDSREEKQLPLQSESLCKRYQKSPVVAWLRDVLIGGEVTHSLIWLFRS